MKFVQDRPLDWKTRAKVWFGASRLAGLWLESQWMGALGLGSLHRRHLERYVRDTGLFDEAFYLSANPDVAAAGSTAVAHYVLYGDREGRSPCALFQPRFYRANTPGQTKRVNALLHYWHVGRHLGYRPCEYFDPQHYLTNNPDVAAAGADALKHFISDGGREGRAPSADFDSKYYLTRYPDVAEARVNPLMHFMLYGHAEGRSPRDDFDDDMAGGDGRAEPAEFVADWDAVMQLAPAGPPAVDVVIPVYKGRSETLRCIYSALTASVETPFELIVINDASPDPELVADLERLAQRGLFTLLHNAVNAGFVHTANRGMVLHLDRDVLLLNSDTEVYAGWLDRLMAVARAYPKAATITPLSNSATICSYPRFNHDNPFPLEIPYAEVDRLTAEVNRGVVVEAPTGVGFCMVMRRDAITDVGVFDEAAFGKGYGEENDFCQRAIKRGWTNLIAADVFVRHLGGASFQGEKEGRVRAAIATLKRKHPRYDNDVSAFVVSDPLAVVRERLDWGRLQRFQGKGNVLLVSHNRGGGTERHIREDTARLEAEGKGVYFLRPQKGGLGRLVISHPKIRSFANLPVFDLNDDAGLVTALQHLGITEMHTHGLVDFPRGAPEKVTALAKRLGARYEVNLHDYKVICPRLNLIDEEGIYCGEPDDASCNQCLQRRGSDFGVTDIVGWRVAHGAALRAADRVYAPHEDVQLRINRYFPDVYVEVAPHEALDLAAVPTRYPALGPDERLRVVVIGAIGKIKGYDVLKRSALHAQANGLPIDFVVMGFSADDHALREAGVVVTGRYVDAEADRVLARLQPHLVWLPSTWPETYSYTLSLALVGGYPVVAFDLGAIASRLRAVGQGELLLGLEAMGDAEAVNRMFMSFFSDARAPATAGA